MAGEGAASAKPAKRTEAATTLLVAGEAWVTGRTPAAAFSARFSCGCDCCSRPSAPGAVGAVSFSETSSRSLFFWVALLVVVVVVESGAESAAAAAAAAAV